MATLPDSAEFNSPQMKKLYQLYINKFGERYFSDLQNSITIMRLGGDNLDKESYQRYEYLVQQAINSGKRIKDGEIDDYVFQATTEQLT